MKKEELHRIMLTDRLCAQRVPRLPMYVHATLDAL